MPGSSAWSKAPSTWVLRIGHHRPLVTQSHAVHHAAVALLAVFRRQPVRAAGDLGHGQARLDQGDVLRDVLARVVHGAHHIGPRAAGADPPGPRDVDAHPVAAPPGRCRRPPPRSAERRAVRTPGTRGWLRCPEASSRVSIHSPPRRMFSACSTDQISSLRHAPATALVHRAHARLPGVDRAAHGPDLVGPLDGAGALGRLLALQHLDPERLQRAQAVRHDLVHPELAVAARALGQQVPDLAREGLRRGRASGLRPRSRRTTRPSGPRGSAAGGRRGTASSDSPRSPYARRRGAVGPGTGCARSTTAMLEWSEAYRMLSGSNIRSPAQPRSTTWAVSRSHRCRRMAVRSGASSPASAHLAEREPRRPDLDAVVPLPGAARWVDLTDVAVVLVHERLHGPTQGSASGPARHGGEQPGPMSFLGGLRPCQRGSRASRDTPRRRPRVGPKTHPTRVDGATGMSRATPPGLGTRFGLVSHGRLEPEADLGPRWRASRSSLHANYRQPDEPDAPMTKTPD